MYLAVLLHEEQASGKERGKKRAFKHDAEDGPGLEELWKCLNGWYKTNRREPRQLITGAAETLISHSVAKVSLLAESKATFLSCQTFQLLLTQ